MNACAKGVSNKAMDMKSSENKDISNTLCDDCGAVVPGGAANCKSVFDEVLVREYSDYSYARSHRLTVDSYSLQHPESYMRSGKSFAAHLTGMCAALEYEDSSAINRAVQEWLNGAKAIDKPARLPGHRGGLTIIYIHDAANGEEHNKRVQEWARSVWSAWSEYHDLAREWIREATSNASVEESRRGIQG
jgi:hypothetical protein